MLSCIGGDAEIKRAILFECDAAGAQLLRNKGNESKPMRIDRKSKLNIYTEAPAGATCEISGDALCCMHFEGTFGIGTLL
jgi:hypothetical protein